MPERLLLKGGMSPNRLLSVADPDLELNGGGFDLLALPAFLPSVISFFTRNKGGCQAPQAGPPDPSPRPTTDYQQSFAP